MHWWTQVGLRVARLKVIGILTHNILINNIEKMTRSHVVPDVTMDADCILGREFLCDDSLNIVKNASKRTVDIA